MKTEHSELAPEVRRGLLQQELSDFAQAATPERERSLPKVIKAIHDLAGPEQVITDPTFQSDLESAVQSALATSYDLPRGETVNPWQGAYTVVAIDRAGAIKGGLANTGDEVYRLFGDNLFPYALSKATVRLHLELAERPGGLDSDDNYEYIKSLLPDDLLLYKGEGAVEAIAGQNEHPELIIGASGSPLTEEYKADVAPGMVGQTAEDTVSFLAGSADEEFAELVATYLARPNLPLESIPEQRDYSRLRRAH